MSSERSKASLAQLGNTHRREGDKPADELIKFRVTPDEKQQYQQEAEKAGLTLSKWIKGLLREAVNGKE